MSTLGSNTGVFYLAIKNAYCGVTEGWKWGFLKWIQVYGFASQIAKIYSKLVRLERNSLSVFL